jgi:hypothetical protein
LIIVAWTLAGISFAAAQTVSLTIPIDSAGKVSADVAIAKASASAGSVNINVLALPFSLRDDAPRPRSPEDVRIAILGKGDGYTLFALAIPSNRQSTIIRFDDPFKLSESSEGKAKISMDLSFPFLSQPDKELIASASALQLNQVSIELPREYDMTELSFRPLSAIWATKRKLSVAPSSLSPAGELWIVFPNPMKSQLQIAKAVIAFLVGMFTLSAHIPAFQRRSVQWSVIVFLLASGLLVLIFYYAYSLAKQLDFVEWAVGFVPHAIYGLGSSIYLLVARKYQATITGIVTANGTPREFAEVNLWQNKNGTMQKVKSVDHLEDGRYVFRTWVRGNPERFVVKASAAGTEEATGEEFEVARGARQELGPLSLPWRPAPPPAPNAQPSTSS